MPLHEAMQPETARRHLAESSFLVSAIYRDTSLHGAKTTLPRLVGCK
jgi:hypothetical protein